MGEPQRAFFNRPKRLQSGETAARWRHPAQGDFFRVSSPDFRIIVVPRGQDRKADYLGPSNFDRIHLCKIPTLPSSIQAFCARADHVVGAEIGMRGGAVFHMSSISARVKPYPPHER